MSKPSFPKVFAQGLALAAERRGYHAYLPSRLLLCFGSGALVAWQLPSELWSVEKRTDLIAIFSALLAFNGLLLAIGWGAFSRIYELIGAGPFAAFLKRNDILKYHILFIEIAQVTLVFASVSSGFGVFSAWLSFELWFDKLIMTATIGLTGYAIIKAIEATQAMNEILWEAADFQNQDG